jgi:SAM-dependent methyltransferase
LPGIDYVGVDMSRAYVEAAAARYGNRGRFLVGDVTDLPALGERKFDAVLAHGVLHHLDDREARSLLSCAAAMLAPGGRMVTVDGCRHERQGAIERFLVNHDRGRNVRTPEAYRPLAGSAFASVRCELRSDVTRFRYTLCYMIATR